MTSKQAFLSDAQVKTLNERHGWFKHGDGQSGVSRAFANDAVEAHERLRAAAPEMLQALTSVVEALDKGGLDDVMCCNGWDCGCRAATNGELLVHDLRALIAKATGAA